MQELEVSKPTEPSAPPDSIHTQGDSQMVQETRGHTVFTVRTVLKIG